MMGSAERDEVFRFVTSAFRTRIEMVNIDVARVSTSRHATAMIIASPHGASHGRRNRLGRPPGTLCTHVGQILFVEQLAVATRHLDRFVVHLDSLTVRFLFAPTTARANLKKNLIARASIIRRPTERAACEEQECRIIVELLRSVPTDLGHRVPIRRERLRRELDMQHVLSQGRICRVFGAIARLSTSDAPFHFAQRPPARRPQPFLLGAWIRDARQLTHRRSDRHRRQRRARTTPSGKSTCARTIDTIEDRLHAAATPVARFRMVIGGAGASRASSRPSS